MNDYLIDDTLYLTENDIFILKKGKKENIYNVLNLAKEKNPKKIISNYKIKDNNVSYIKNIKKYENEYLNKTKITPTIIGVTGTNGKTSTTTIIYETLKSLNKKTMLIGTNGIYFNDLHLKTRNTTISKLAINYLINKYLDNNSFLIMELSSQGYKRINNLKFDYIIFTNLSNEHLDYHKTMYNYFNAKKKILKLIKKEQNLFINIDDKYGVKLSKIFKESSKYSLKNIKINSLNPISFYVKDKLINSKLTGEFNIYNLYSSFLILNRILKEDFIYNLNLVNEIKGRNNLINFKNRNIVIDYAHTPNSIHNILDFYSSIKHNKIYVIIGFGGNRDKKKRPLMLNECLKYTNNIIITEDNSRDEKFNDIIKFTLKKIQNNLMIIQNRKEAIHYAVNRLKENDYLLILGKGNEEYIIKNNKKENHNDYEEVYKCINS